MSFNPFEEKAIPVEKTFMDWKTMYPKPYNKNTVDPYTKTRIVLMNGTEFEAQWFSRNFSRHCPDNCLRRELAMMRRTEQQQQKRISNLMIVVFPAPVGPTIATFCPGFTSTLKSLMIV